MRLRVEEPPVPPRSMSPASPVPHPLPQELLLHSLSLCHSTLTSAGDWQSPSPLSQGCVPQSLLPKWAAEKSSLGMGGRFLSAEKGLLCTSAHSTWFCRGEYTAHGSSGCIKVRSLPLVCASEVARPSAEESRKRQKLPQSCRDEPQEYFPYLGTDAAEVE